MSVPAVPPTSCVDTSHVASLSCRSLEFTAEEASRPEAPVRGAVRSQEAPGSVSGARLESTACEQQRFPLSHFSVTHCPCLCPFSPPRLPSWVPHTGCHAPPALVGANLRHGTGGIAHISTGSSCLPGPQPCLPPSLPPRACGAALILAFGSWISPPSLHGPQPTPQYGLGLTHSRGVGFFSRLGMRPTRPPVSPPERRG